jgi:tetratricopeptide (TPR) repeat protein
MRSLIFLLATAVVLPAAAYDNYDAAIRQGTALANTRHFTEAISLLKKSYAHATAANQIAWGAFLQNNLGFVYEKQGKYTEAEDSFRHALRSMSQVGRLNGPESAPIMGNLGALYYEAGRFSEAEHFLKTAIDDLRTPTGQVAQMGVLVNNLAAVYLAEHKNQMAQTTAEQGLTLWGLQPSDSTGLGYSYSVLAEAYNRLGLKSQAESSFQRAIAIWTSTNGPNDPQTAKGMVNLGAFYFSNGESLRAEPLFQRASKIFKASSSNDTFHLYFLQVYSKLQKALGHKREAKDLDKQVSLLAPDSAHQQIAKDVLDASAFRPDR